LHRIPDFQQAAFPILPPLMIPEAKRFNVLFRQEFSTRLVAVNPFRQTMLKAIQLNRQFRIGTIKIQNVSADGVLPAEFETGEASSA
jgi:hypothetical protein